MQEVVFIVEEGAPSSPAPRVTSDRIDDINWVDPIQKFAQEWTGWAGSQDAWIYILGNAREANAALPEYLRHAMHVSAQ